MGFEDIYNSVSRGQSVEDQEVLEQADFEDRQAEVFGPDAIESNEGNVFYEVQSNIEQDIATFISSIADMGPVNMTTAVLNYFDNASNPDDLLIYLSGTNLNDVIDTFIFAIFEESIFAALISNLNLLSEHIDHIFDLLEEVNPYFFEETDASLATLEVLIDHSSFSREHAQRLLEMCVNNNMRETVLTFLEIDGVSSLGELNLDQIIDHFDDNEIRFAVINSSQNFAYYMHKIRNIDDNDDFVFYYLATVDVLVGDTLSGYNIINYFEENLSELFDYNASRNNELALLLLAKVGSEFVVRYVYYSNSIRKDDQIVQALFHAGTGAHFVGGEISRELEYHDVLRLFTDQNLTSFQKLAAISNLRSEVANRLLDEYPCLQHHVQYAQVSFLNSSLNTDLYYEFDPSLDLIVEYLPASYLTNFDVPVEEVSNWQRVLGHYFSINGIGSPSDSNIRGALVTIREFMETYGSLEIYSGRNVVEFNSSEQWLGVGPDRFDLPRVQRAIEDQGPASYFHYEFEEDLNTWTDLIIDGEVAGQGRTGDDSNIEFIEDHMIGTPCPMTCTFNGHGLPESISLQETDVSVNTLANIIVARYELHREATSQDIYILPMCFGNNIVMNIIDKLNDADVPIPIFLTQAEFNQISYGQPHLARRYGNVFTRELLLRDNVTLGDFMELDMDDVAYGSSPTVVVPASNPENGYIQISDNEIEDSNERAA